MTELPKTYDPQTCEAATYAAWMDKKTFAAKVNPNKKPYCIVIPPPNITGQLHMGHALDNTMQDILIRFKRMQGFEALWMPGTDHASIATEVKIIEQLEREGISKKDLGREGFLQRAWDWRVQYGGRIVGQLKRLGCSCDWDRERFTMDEGCSHAVTEVFVTLYEKGLIYQGNRIISWCPDCKTALSDAEVEYQPQDGHLWHIRYPLTDGSGHITVATTRPETMLGDMAVAVHPEDERYAALVGKTLKLPLTDREIPIVADTYVEPEFGSGAVKITPAHDPNDYEVAIRHDLPMMNVMDEGGTMLSNAGKYAGLDRFAARDAVVADLQAAGLLIQTEPYAHNVGVCYRCGTVVEPRLSLQWFVKMAPLAEPAVQAVKDGRVDFVPERFDKTYFNWMENIRDWCVSRQLWWGHRIPAWHCACGQTVVARCAPASCPDCGGDMQQDNDVLDTWFSSALWPFSTLGWPEKTPELDYFYPTDTLVTGYDIIFFWVARMVFSGLAHMGEVPFRKVVIHGLVRDEQGRKMSKSLGNGIDPLEIIDEFGADALRYALIAGNAPGNDMRFYRGRVEHARNFTNKLWNAAKFLLNGMETAPTPWKAEDLTMPQQWILHSYAKVVRVVTAHLESFDLGMALTAIYEFLWNSYCDWAIELAKPVLYGTDEAARQTQQSVLLEVLCGTLKLLHPFMPFITEELYAHLPAAQGFLMQQAWPEVAHIPDFTVQAAAMEDVMEVVRSVRNLRSELKVPPSKQAPATLVAQPGHAEGLHAGLPTALRLAGISEITFADAPDAKDEGRMAVAVCAVAQVFLPLADLVDLGAERQRLQKELDACEGEIKRALGCLDNPDFMARAKPTVVEAQREKLNAAMGIKQALTKQLETLG